MLDFQIWIERNAGNWTYREILLGFLIALVAIATLNFAWQEQVQPTKFSSTQANRRWLDRDDPRGFAPPPSGEKSQVDDGYFDVAWISGSPAWINGAPPEWRLKGKQTYEMSDVLARYLTTVDGVPIRMQKFFLQGMRTGDQRRGVLFAAQDSAIDAYIIDANPVWMFNDYLLFTLSRQRASILQQKNATWFDYKLAALLLKPSEIGFELIGALFPAASDRYRIFRGMSLGDGTPFPLIKKPVGVRDGQTLGRWLSLFHPEVDKLRIAEEASSLRSYRSAMMMGDLTESGLGGRIFGDSLKTLAETEKPVLVFMPPINPIVKSDQASVAYVDDVVDRVAKIVAETKSPRVAFFTDTVWADAQPATYRDILHLQHGQGVIDLVVDRLERAIGKQFVKRPLHEVYDRQ